jgi:hypothetical protein
MVRLARVLRTILQPIVAEITANLPRSRRAFLSFDRRFYANNVRIDVAKGGGTSSRDDSRKVSSSILPASCAQAALSRLNQTAIRSQSRLFPVIYLFYILNAFRTRRLTCQ